MLEEIDIVKTLRQNGFTIDATYRTGCLKVYAHLSAKTHRLSNIVEIGYRVCVKYDSKDYSLSIWRVNDYSNAIHVKEGLRERIPFINISKTCDELITTLLTSEEFRPKARDYFGY